jgi:hypothetical protein
MIALALPAIKACSNIFDLALSTNALLVIPPIPKKYVADELPLTLSTTSKFFMLKLTTEELLLTFETYAE